MKIRFPKGKWIKAMNELLDDAAYFDPGDPEWYGNELVHLSKPQVQRMEARHFDFQEIGERALSLRDALSTLRH